MVIKYVLKKKRMPLGKLMKKKGIICTKWCSIIASYQEEVRKDMKIMEFPPDIHCQCNISPSWQFYVLFKT